MQPDKDKLQKLITEKSLVIIKPDGVLRGIVGELITRFERKGLKIIGMKMLWPNKDLVAKHYTDSEEWLMDTGTRAYNNYVEKGVKIEATPKELAMEIRNRLVDLMTAGPVVVLVLQGAHAIEVVRRMRGSTSPLKADVGTIGFDYTLESYELADTGGWAIRNVIHASDSNENADREINIWFTKNEILDYSTAIDDILYGINWYGGIKRD